MVAKQKIVPGDVLVVEPAFSTSLFREFYSTHCLHCFETIKEEPVCCPGCSTVGSNNPNPNIFLVSKTLIGIHTT